MLLRKSQRKDVIKGSSLIELNISSLKIFFVIFSMRSVWLTPPCLQSGRKLEVQTVLSRDACHGDWYNQHFPNCYNQREMLLFYPLEVWFKFYCSSEWVLTWYVSGEILGVIWGWERNIGSQIRCAIKIQLFHHSPIPDSIYSPFQSAHESPQNCPQSLLINQQRKKVAKVLHSDGTHLQSLVVSLVCTACRVAFFPLVQDLQDLPL